MNPNAISIETPRLSIRDLAVKDFPRVHEFASDPEVVRFEAWGPNTEIDTRDFLIYAIASAAATPRRAFELGVFERGRSEDPDSYADGLAGELIGTCGLRILSDTHRHAEFGYTLRKDRWGRGYGTEVARALVRFGFSASLALHRLSATCHVDHEASARVLRKAGLREEGLLRGNVLQRGEWRDSRLFAILEGDVRSDPRSPA